MQRPLKSGTKRERRTILIVDGDASAATAARRALEADGHLVEVAVDGTAALETFASAAPALVLLDAESSGVTDLDALRAIRPRDRYVSLVLASSNPASSDLVRGLDAGADDYVAKPYDPAVLAARVRAQLRIKDLNDRLKDANEKLVQLVDIDDLTGLYNMRSIYDRLGQELVRAQRFGRPTAAVMIDIDDFKLVNDENDHLFGSFVLKEIGRIVAATVRRVDLAARYGGDEFLVILPETALSGARIFAERLRRAIEAFDFRNGRSAIRLTASFGISVSEPNENRLSARPLVRCADLALYEAKAAGKNCVRDRLLALEMDPAEQLPSAATGGSPSAKIAAKLAAKGGSKTRGRSPKKSAS